MWRVVERMSRGEPSRGVLQGLLSGPLYRVAGAETDKVADLTNTIFDRVRKGPGAKRVRELCIGIFTGSTFGVITPDAGMSSWALRLTLQPILMRRLTFLHIFR